MGHVLEFMKKTASKKNTLSPERDYGTGMVVELTSAVGKFPGKDAQRLANAIDETIRKMNQDPAQSGLDLDVKVLKSFNKEVSEGSEVRVHVSGGGKTAREVLKNMIQGYVPGAGGRVILEGVTSKDGKLESRWAHNASPDRRDLLFGLVSPPEIVFKKADGSWDRVSIGAFNTGGLNAEIADRRMKYLREAMENLDKAVKNPELANSIRIYRNILSPEKAISVQESDMEKIQKKIEDLSSTGLTGDAFVIRMFSREKNVSISGRGYIKSVMTNGEYLPEPVGDSIKRAMEAMSSASGTETKMQLLSEASDFSIEVIPGMQMTMVFNPNDPTANSTLKEAQGYVKRYMNPEDADHKKFRASVSNDFSIHHGIVLTLPQSENSDGKPMLYSVINGDNVRYRSLDTISTPHFPGVTSGKPAQGHQEEASPEEDHEDEPFAGSALK